VLCHGPSQGNRITFVSPAAWLENWKGIPSLDAAAGTVIRAYLRAHGPTTAEKFDKVWLSRGGTPKALLRGWFAALEDELATVRVDGTDLVMLAEDVPQLLEQAPSDTVRLLGGFDPYILGAGTNTTQIIAAEHRAAVSRAGGWIAPVVLQGGRAAGTWTLADDAVDIGLWEDVPDTALEAEVDRIAAFLGRRLRLR